MKIGVSTASLYPLHVEDAFKTLCDLGITTAEIFANSTIEGQEPIVSEICSLRDKNNVKITSFHPFSSPMESVFLFSDYDRRIDEMLAMYRGFFKSMNKLGAKIFVLHGAILSSKCSPAHYMKQFSLLSEAGREFGITVAQENVSYCMSGKLEFLKKMKRDIPDAARFVLDLKQARRSGENPLDYIKELGESVVHCHISDADENRDCLAVGAGKFDFESLLKAFSEKGYDGTLIVELYRRDYGEFSELKKSADYLAELCDKLNINYSL